MSCCPTCGQTMPKPPKKRAWTPEDDEWLRGAIKAGWKHEAIAEALGRPKGSIGSRLRTLESKTAVPDDDDDADPVCTTVEHRPGVRIITRSMK